MNELLQDGIIVKNYWNDTPMNKENLKIMIQTSAKQKVRFTWNCN